jgi:hypothetical protein
MEYAMHMKRPTTEEGHLDLIKNIKHILAMTQQKEEGYETLLKELSRAERWLIEFREKAKAKQEREAKAAAKRANR